MDDNEQNNNDNNNIVKQAIKTETNNIKNGVMKKIIHALLPILFNLLILLLIAGLLLLIVSVVVKAITGFFNGNNTDNSTKPTIKEEVRNAVSLSEDGYNYIINQEFIDNIIRQLINGSVDPNALGITDNATLDENNNVDYGGKLDESMIKQYVEAEIRTMLPKIGSKDIDGIVNIKRDNGEEGSEPRDLKYEPYEQLKKDVADEEKKEGTIDYFSINPETFDLCYTTSTVVEVYNQSGALVSRTVNVTLNESEYQYALTPYSMTISFLTATHVVAQDNDFMKDLLSLQKDGKYIDLTLRDNKSVETEIASYSGEANYTEEEEQEVNGVTTTVTVPVTITIDTDNAGQFISGAKPAKVVTTTITSEMMVTKADTWIAKVENTYSKTEDIVEQTPYSEQYSGPYRNGTFSATGTFSGSLKTTKYTELNSNTDMEASVDKIVNLIKYGNIDGIPEGLTEKEAIEKNKYIKVANNLYSGAQFYFKLLEEDERNQNIEQVMKYVLYKVTGKDYGVTDLSEVTSLFNESQFSYNFDASSDFMVDTSKSDKSLVLSKEQLTQGINAIYSGKQRENLLSAIDAFVEIQEKYHVNAVFAIALARIESSCGTAWDAIASSTYNWMSVTGSYKGKTYHNPNSTNPRWWRVYSSFSEATLDNADNIANGSYYFKAGKYTVSDIQPVYGGADKATYMNYISEFYSKLGINTSSSAPTTGSNDAKLKYLFPDGVPTTASECAKYITTVKVPMTSKTGTKFEKNIQVHKSLASDVEKVFEQAQTAGFKIYDASGYSFRYMNNGSSGKLSHHSYGCAIDINVNENYSHRGSTIYAGSFWNPSTSEFSIPRNGALVKAFESIGWKWGGNWSGNYQDYMHFSYTGN